MNVQMSQDSEAVGFSAPIGRELDSERTLVLVLASPQFAQNRTTITTISERN